MGKTLTRDEIRTLYHPPVNRFVEVEVPPLSYLVLDGRGDPAGREYQDAVKWLLASIVPLRKLARERMGADFVEPPLETLYWTDTQANLACTLREEWHWRAMIVLAEWMDDEMLAAAITNASRALGQAPGSLRREEMHEGPSIQFLHEGPPTVESDMVARLYGEYLPSKRLAPRDAFHEIYLTDARRVAPARLRTVLRQPVRPLG
jgi:hypothetical protein